MVPKETRYCGVSLRSLCFLIAYMHLLSSVVDLVCHVMTVAIATNGFQCEVNNESLKDITIPWLEPIFVILNLGTHGFYPYPRVFRNHYHMYVEQMPVTAEPRCYPGMLHIYQIDLLNFLINVIWLRIVLSYVGAVHKRDPEPMRMFFSLSVVKLVMQAMYFGYQPFFYTVYAVETVWLLKLTDVFLAVIILTIVQKYIKFLKMEKAASTLSIEKPPSYIECLINSPNLPPTYETAAKDEVVIIVDGKQNSESQEQEVAGKS